jgi:hypothetical protein
MEEELEILKEVCGKLDSAEIEYMITGSIAMAFYSAPRMTRDIDIIINVSVNDIEKVINLFQKGYYINEIVVKEAIKNRSMFNIIHNESVIKIDFIIRKDELYRIEEFSRRQEIKVDNSSVSVVSPEDLILSKLFWVHQSDSELQLRDVKNILAMMKNIDKDYLVKWSKILKIEKLIQEVIDNA